MIRLARASGFGLGEIKQLAIRDFVLWCAELNEDDCG